MWLIASASVRETHFRSFEAWNICTFYFKLLWLSNKNFVDTNFSFHHFLFDIEIRLKFSMNLLRKINEKYIHMRRVQCNDSSMLFRKEDIFASHKWSKRGLSQKKFTRCQALFIFVFSISFPILYSFWVSLLIPHQYISIIIVPLQKTFWIPKNKRKPNFTC